MENVSKWDNIQEQFKEKVQEVARKYPKANYQALVSFINLLPETKKSLPEVVQELQHSAEEGKGPETDRFESTKNLEFEAVQSVL